MKQPMAYGKGKAAKIRNMRKTAQSMHSRQKVYKRIDSITETGAGTEEYRVTVKLVDGWSFSETENVVSKTFNSTAELMRGVSKTYHSQPIIAVEEEIKEVMTWQEKLDALSKLKKEDKPL